MRRERNHPRAIACEAAAAAVPTSHTRVVASIRFRIRASRERGAQAGPVKGRTRIGLATRSDVAVTHDRFALEPGVGLDERTKNPDEACVLRVV